MTNKIQALKDFLSEIISIIGTDSKSTKTFADIEKSIDEVMKLEKGISKIMMNNGYQDETTGSKLDKRKYDELGKVVPAVIPKSNRSMSVHLHCRLTGKN